MKKIYIIVLSSILFITQNTFSQGNTCAQATPFCTSVGTPFVYPNVHNGSMAPTGNSYGCLCQSDAKNPSWFYLKTTAAGNMNFTIKQTNSGGTGIDVDFVAWGPFSSPSSMCSGLTGSCSGGTGSVKCSSTGGGSFANQTCTGGIVDCESSPASIETMNIPSGGPNEYYLIMITNYNGAAGTMSLTQNSGPPTNCDITCPTVLSGPGLVQAQSTATSAAVSLPSTVSCTSGLINMYASNNTPFGHPIQPAVLVTTYANGQNGNTIKWYENGSLVLTSGQLTPNTSFSTLFTGVDPTATTSFSFCETVNSSDMASAIGDAATGTAINSSYTWVSDAVCAGYTLPAGSVKGITSWTSTCGSCLTGVTNWGFAKFDPGAAGIGTHTITYSFNPQKAGCSTFTTQAVITVTNPFDATFTPPGPFCANNACTILTPQNTYGVGTPGWSGTGVSTNSFCPSTSGAGTFAVTYSVGTTATCRSTYSANVIVNALPTVTASASNSGTLCAGSSINLNAGGANTYTWTPGGSNSSAITVTPAASPATYTVQGTNTTTGCKNQAVVSVTTIPTPTINVTGPAGANAYSICPGGSAALNASGGSTYTWSPATGLSGTSGSAVTASPTITTVYSVTGSSAGGCNTTASTQGTFTVYVYPTPTIGITPSNSGTVCAGSSITLTGTGAGGSGTYSWSAPAGGGLSGTSGSVVNITPTSSPLTYTVIGTTVGGCTNTAQTTITVSPSPTISVTNSLSTNSSTICSGKSVILTASGATSYTWSPATGLSATTGGTVTASPTNTASPTIYTVTGTSSSGCTNSASSIGTFTVTVNQTPNAGITPANSGTVCSGSTISLTGTGASTYSWSAPAGGGLSSTSGSVVNITPTSSPITYTVLATSVAGCTNTAQTTITVSPSPTITVTNSLSTNSSTICSGKTVTLTASGASSYSWSPATGLSATTGATVFASPTNTAAPTIYTVTGSSSSGCANLASSQGTFTVTVNPLPIANASVSNTLTCTNTTISLTGSGGGTYAWSGPGITSGSATATPSVNTPGNYSLVVTSPAGCVSTMTTVTVTQNTVAPSVSGANTGSLNCTVLSVNASATTITSPVSYTWTGAGITSAANISTITVNQGGTYNYTVTNTINNCKTTGSQTIVQNTTTPISTASTTGSITCVTNTVNLLSSLAGMNYTWTAPSGSSIVSGSSLQNAVGQGLGTYTLNILNPANTCTYSTTIAAIQNTTTPASVSAGPTRTLVCGVSSVTLTGSASPGTATASWQGGVTSPNSFTTTTGAAGTYTLLAIEPTTGCSISSTVTVLQSIGAPSVTANAVTNSITCTNSMVTIGVTVTSPDPVIYQWPSTGISGPTNGATATATLAGVYNVTVTNSPGNNCTSINSISVPLDVTPVTASVTPASSITCSVPTVTLNASPVGAYTYTWTGASPIFANDGTQNPVVNAGGTYSVAITNTVNGCVGGYSITVPSNTVIPTVLISSPSVTTTCGNPTATLSITSNPSSGVTYSWTAPASGSLDSYTVSAPVASGSGIFTVVVTNTVSGCSSSLTQNTVEVIPDLAIPQTTLSVNSVSITCSNPTPSVSITTNVSNVSYSWTPSSGIVAGTETTSTPSFSLPGTYSAVVTNTTSGCSTSTSGNVVNVVLDNVVSSVSLSSGVNDGTVTCSNPTVVVTPTVTPANANLTYNWLPGTGMSSPANQASASFTAAGVYTLVVTNTVTGCVTTLTNSANTFTVYQNTTIPTMTLTSGVNDGTITCNNPSVVITPTVNPSNSTYVWTSGTGTVAATSSVTITTPGVYTLSVTDATTGCVSSNTNTANTFTVYQNTTTPTMTLTSGAANDGTITCSNPSVVITPTVNPSNSTYVWTSATGTVATTSSVTITTPGVYTLSVTDATTGCVSSNTNTANTFTVYQNTTTPTMTLTSGAANDGTITCSNPSVVITPTINPSNSTYVWTSGTGTVATTSSVTITTPGVYTLSVTDAITGCVSSNTNTANTFTVYLDIVVPTASINAVSTNSIIGCGGAGSSVTLGSIITSSNTAVLTWLPGNVNTPTLNVTSAGVYTLNVVDAVNSCSTTTQYTVVGNTTPPQGVDAGASVLIPCSSPTVALNGTTTSTNSVSYSWSGPSVTSIISGGTTTTPVIGETGIYTLTVTDNLTGCQSTATVNVSQANVTATFTADPTSGLSPLTVNFTDGSTGATNWNWNFGDSNTSNQQNPTNVFATGSYTVVLTVSSGPCTATTSVVIVVEDGLTLEIPNVFTPNGDNINDIFTIKSTGVKEISLQIFNRWGEKLYEFAGPNAAWDGLTTAGNKVSEGTYFFFVKATGFDGKEIEKNGTVTLFR